MTRAQAIEAVVGAYGHAPPGEWRKDAAEDFVRMLEALGLLHLETTEDSVRIAAAKMLSNKLITAHNRGSSTAQIDLDGAYEILDILTKSGFRVTRDEK